MAPASFSCQPAPDVRHPQIGVTVVDLPLWRAAISSSLGRSTALGSGDDHPTSPRFPSEETGIGRSLGR
jgi:hypothetical protein